MAEARLEARPEARRDLSDRAGRERGRTTLLTRRQVRAVVGALWLLDACLQAQPELFRASWWRGDFAGAAMGEPVVLGRAIVQAADLVARAPAAWNAAFVAVELGLGLALLTNTFARFATLASIPWALAVWSVGEAFGMLPSGFALLGAGAPGAVCLYPCLALLAWPRLGPDGAEKPVGVAPRAALAVWVVLWAGQALLHLPWRFSATQVLTANIVENADGPGWLRVLDHHALALVAAHGQTIGALLAVLEVLIGVGVCFPRWRRLALGAALPLLALDWLVLQGLGHLLAGGATDPGLAPLVALLGLALWPRAGTLAGVCEPSRAGESPVSPFVCARTARQEDSDASAHPLPASAAGPGAPRRGSRPRDGLV